MLCRVTEGARKLTVEGGEDALPEPAASGVTQLLLEWRGGDEEALEKLTPIVYGELRRLGQHYMEGERQGHTLQATALVHEAYLRLVGLDVEWEGRGHFFAIAARLMRQVLVDYARRRTADKRGGDAPTISLEGLEVPLQPATELLALDQALERLAAFDERKSRIVELRFFGGLTLKETAEVLEVSRATVERELKLARAWLSRQLSAE